MGDTKGEEKSGSSRMNCARIPDRGKAVKGRRVPGVLQDEVRAVRRRCDGFGGGCSVEPLLCKVCVLLFARCR
jgi:hypothetical protein